ncbi:MAG TPA: S9 family peptidase [Thermomicrobiales bacterium]
MHDSFAFDTDESSDSLGVGRYLGIPAATTPAWLADGRLAYLSDATDVPQIWVTDTQVTVGAPPPSSRPLTTYADRIGALLAAPGGGRLVFGMDTGGDERQQLWTAVPGEPPRAVTANPGTIHTLGAVSPDGNRVAFASNARVRHAFDVWTVDLTDPSAAPRPVLATDELLTPVAWTADGRGLVVQRANTNLDHDLLLVPADGGEPTLLTPHTGEATMPQVVATPDGEALILVSNHDREFAALVGLDLATRQQTLLAAPEHDVEAAAITPAGDILAYAVNDDGYSRLTLRELATGTERAVTDPPAGVASGLKWSHDGTRLAFALSSPRNPSAIWVSDTNGTATQATTVDLATLDSAPFVAPETVRYPTFDRRAIPAFWYRPNGGDGGSWPVVIDVHGGPESQRRPEFAPVTQALLAGGIAVLAPNVRGSTGYGKTYCHLDDRERRMDAVADLAAAVDWLRARPEVDPARIAVMGQSYGGFMVLAALTAYPDLWAAGVDVVGIANFVTFLEQTGPWRRRVRAAEYGELPRDADLLRAISPLRKADQITAPLLVIHGRNDPRVPLGEAEQIVARLRSLGRDVELLVFADEGHGLVKRPNRRTGYGTVGDFLSRRLLSKAG